MTNLSELFLFFPFHLNDAKELQTSTESYGADLTTALVKNYADADILKGVVDQTAVTAAGNTSYFNSGSFTSPQSPDNLREPNGNRTQSRSVV